MATRLRRVSSTQEMERVLDDYFTQGYEVLQQGERTTMLRKKTWGTGGGHVLCALLTFWWTIGIGNLVYACIAHFTADQVMLKVEPEPA
jgi:hypothetical protein